MRSGELDRPIAASRLMDCWLMVVLVRVLVR